MTRQEALVKMLAMVTTGDGVLTAGEIHPDIPTIHNVSHRDGARLKSTVEVSHCGFGLFKGVSPNGHEFFFDGGGAMRRAEADEVGEGFSWCPFTAGSGVPFEAHRDTITMTGYDFHKVASALQELVEEYE
jgi:hypothetical protein